MNESYVIKSAMEVLLSKRQIEAVEAVKAATGRTKQAAVRYLMNIGIRNRLSHEAAEAWERGDSEGYHARLRRAERKRLAAQ